MDKDMVKFEFRQGDRMRRAMQVAGYSVQDMAEIFAVARETVSTWLNDRHAPSKAALIVWADKTGAPLEWLVTGHFPTPDKPEDWWKRDDEYPQTQK